MVAVARAVSRVLARWSVDLVARTGWVLALVLTVVIGIEAVDGGAVSMAAVGDRAWTLMPLVAALSVATVALDAARSGEWLAWALNGQTPRIFPVLMGALGLTLCLPVLAFREATAPLAEVARAWIPVSGSAGEVLWVRADEWHPPVAARVQWVRRRDGRDLEFGTSERLIWDGQRWIGPRREADFPPPAAWSAGAPLTERCALRAAWTARSSSRAQALLVAQAMTAAWTVWMFASAGLHVFRRGRWGVFFATLVALFGQGTLALSVAGMLDGAWTVRQGALAWALAVGPLSLVAAGGRSWTTERSA